MSTSGGVSWSTKGMQSVCPTGISTFDRLIGGGFALSSINLIDEDCNQVYSTMLTKAYIALAIHCKQRVIIFIDNNVYRDKLNRFLNELPSVLQTNTDSVSDGGISAASNSEEKESMKIAFHYANLPSRFLASQEGEDISAQKLDFGAHIPRSQVVKAKLRIYEHRHINSVLQQLVDENKKQQQQSKQSEVTRILILRFGSPLGSLPVDGLPKVVHGIKVLLRRLPNVVCLATLLAKYLHPTPFPPNDCELLDPMIRSRVHNLFDSVIRLISFSDHDNTSGQTANENNPYSADYVGFLHILKLPRLNSFAPYNSTLEGTEFGIKLRNSKRFLAIEKLSLPPDLGETVNRFTTSVKVAEQQKNVNTNFPTCASSSNSMINF